MDRSLQLKQIFEAKHRNGLNLRDALAQVGLAHSTFYDIPQEEREAAEKEVVDKLTAELDETDGALKMARIEAEQAIVRTILDRMPAYIDQLDHLALNARREDVRKAAIDSLIDIARNGVFVPVIHPPVKPTDDTPRLPEPEHRFPLAPPPTMVQPTVIVFTPGGPKSSPGADTVDGEIVQNPTR